MAHAVLIIDDEATLAKNMKAYLERQGFDADIAGSAEDGIARRPDRAEAASRPHAQ